MILFKGIIFFFLPMIVFYLIGGFISLNFNIIKYAGSTRASLVAFGILFGVCSLTAAKIEKWLD